MVIQKIKGIRKFLMVLPFFALMSQKTHSEYLTLSLDSAYVSSSCYDLTSVNSKRRCLNIYLTISNNTDTTINIDKPWHISFGLLDSLKEAGDYQRNGNIIIFLTKDSIRMKESKFFIEDSQPRIPFIVAVKKHENYKSESVGVFENVNPGRYFLFIKYDTKKVPLKRGLFCWQGILISNTIEIEIL